MRSTGKNESGSLGIWLVLSAAAAAVMVLKPLAALSPAQMHWVLGGLAIVIVGKLFFMLRSSCASAGRLFFFLILMALACAVAVTGIPREWLRLPRFSQVSALILPVLLCGVAGMAFLIALAGLRKYREKKGNVQRSYWPLAVNLMIVIAAIQVMRQPAWKASLEETLGFTEIADKRRALEGGVAYWMDQIEHQQGRNGEAAPRQLGTVSTLATTAAQTPAPPARRVAAVHPIKEKSASWWETLTGIFSIESSTSLRPVSVKREDFPQLDSVTGDFTNPETELETVRKLLNRGQKGRALRWLETCRARTCQSPELIRLHADVLRQIGRIDEAASVLEPLAISYDGTLQDGRTCIALWEQARRLDRARTVAQRVLVRNPTKEFSLILARINAAQGF